MNLYRIATPAEWATGKAEFQDKPMVPVTDELLSRVEWEATINYKAREPAWYTDDGYLVVYAPREGEWFLVPVDAAVKEDNDE